jgi:hypothetical protein
MLMTSRDPSVLISLLIVAPISMVLVRAPAIVSILSTYLSTVNTYLIAYSVVANIVLASVYRRRPVVAMYICLVNVVLVAWFVMRTDRYNEKKLIGQCESSTLL